MKLYSLINWRIMVTALCGAGLATGIFASLAQADQWDKKTILTVDQPIQVEETLLPAGRYVLRLVDSNSDRHVVQIFNGDQTHIINTVIAIPNYRLQPTGHSQFAFWETPEGNAKALRAWFYPGDNFGQEFRYPKHLTVLQASAATTTIESVPAPQPAPAAEVPPSQPATPEPVAQPAPPQPVTQEVQPDNRPVETAEAAPPPPPPQSAPPPPPEPQSLPKTGSTYPVIGLAGLLSFGLYGLLRLRRPA